MEIKIHSNSTLGQMADVCVTIPALTVTGDGSSEPQRPTLPGGSLFEQSVLLLGDALVMPLSEKMNVLTDQAFARHANLE